MPRVIRCVHPSSCVGSECLHGDSTPSAGNGDHDQLRRLLHGELHDDIGTSGYTWLAQALQMCPHDFDAVLAQEVVASRLLSRWRSQATVLTDIESLVNLLIGP